jgi:hypothetical protein
MGRRRIEKRKPSEINIHKQKISKKFSFLKFYQLLC